MLDGRKSIALALESHKPIIIPTKKKESLVKSNQSSVNTLKKINVKNKEKKNHEKISENCH